MESDVVQGEALSPAPAAPVRPHWRQRLAGAGRDHRVIWSAWLLVLALLGGLWWQQSAKAPRP